MSSGGVTDFLNRPLGEQVAITLGLPADASAVKIIDAILDLQEKYQKLNAPLGDQLTQAVAWTKVYRTAVDVGMLSHFDPDEDGTGSGRVCGFIKWLKAEIVRLRGAIRNHRDQRGDDRCHLDDRDLYAVLPEGFTPPPHDSAVTLEQCSKFIACRQDPATEYVSPQREIERLRLAVEGHEKSNALLLKGMESQSELMDGLKQETRRQKAEIEKLRKALVQIHDMAEEDLRTDIHGGSMNQIEADARAALEKP